MHLICLKSPKIVIILGERQVARGMRKFSYSYLNNFAWDNEMIGLVSQIHEYKGRQDLYSKQQPLVLDKLVEIAKIQSIESSNKIEGIITTDVRIRDLVEDKTTPKTRDEEEITGYRDVLNTIHESYEFIPVKGSYILQLHKELYKYSEKTFGGRFKNTQNYIAEVQHDGSERIRFTPLAPYETPGAIDLICDSYSRMIDECLIDPLILIPIFISDFLCIHPFNDGNGRMSRLLTALLLYKSGYVVGKYVSIEKKIEKTKRKYYEALETVDAGWHEGENDPTPFIKYFLGIVLSCYRDLEERLVLVESKVPAITMVKNAIENRIGKFTKKEINELIPTISRASIENSLKQLVTEGYIEKHGKGRATFYIRK